MKLEMFSRTSLMYFFFIEKECEVKTSVKLARGPPPFCTMAFTKFCTADCERFVGHEDLYVLFGRDST